MKTIPVVAGVVTSVTPVNQTYANIATGTTTLTDLNTQTEWVTFSHTDSGAHDEVFNSDMNDFCNSDGTYTLTSESYVVIDLGGTDPVRMVYSPTLTWQYSNEIVRVHADINVDAIGELTLPSILGSNQDCFFLQLWYRDGAGVYHAFPQEWAYSVTNYTEFDVTNVTFPTQPAFDYSGRLQTWSEENSRHRFRCSVSGFIPIVASGIDRIELRAKLDTAAVLASVTFKEATMCAFIVRH